MSLQIFINEGTNVHPAERASEERQSRSYHRCRGGPNHIPIADVPVGQQNDLIRVRYGLESPLVAKSPYYDWGNGYGGAVIANTFNQGPKERTMKFWAKMDIARGGPCL